VVEHRIIVAGDAEPETFEARDVIYGGASDQNRDRSHNALTAEWRGTTKRLTGDVAIRRDFFNRFKDATSIRASALAEIGHGFSLAGSYAEGIAQPTFFDLYGFFPSNFVGNPNLKPENSRGFETSVRYRRSSVSASLTAYRQRLYDEIVDVFDPVTLLSSTANTNGISHRWGIEAELGLKVADRLRLGANYAYLHATEPDTLTDRQLTELRRPKHSGAVTADGQVARLSYGASITYVGSHLDREDVAPFGIVRVSSYWLADARIAYALTPAVELFARGSNLFNSRYQEVAGYRTEGIGGFLGIRLRAGRRS
jgi:vitamin B12 transporter